MNSKKNLMCLDAQTWTHAKQKVCDEAKHKLEKAFQHEKPQMHIYTCTTTKFRASSCVHAMGYLFQKRSTVSVESSAFFILWFCVQLRTIFPFTIKGVLFLSTLCSEAVYTMSFKATFLFSGWKVACLTLRV